MDDLDDIFGQSTQSNKKKVNFQDESDPLDNLDFSDDDSRRLFDNANKQESQSFTGNKQQLSHLFGIESSNWNDDETKVNLTAKPSVNATSELASREDSTLNATTASLEKIPRPRTSSSKESNLSGLSDKVAIASENKLAKGMKSIFSNETEDVLTDKPKTAVATALQSKKSLMEDLFGKENDTSKGKSSRVNNGESYSRGLANESANKIAQTAGYSLSASKEPRRGRRSSTTIQNDPFGYLSASALQFGETANDTDKQRTSVAATSNEALPEWLGGSKSSKEQNQQIDTSTVQRELSTNANNTEEHDKTIAQPKAPLVLAKAEEPKQSHPLTSALLGMEFNQRTAMMDMQQQEHELRTATALCQQTDKLNYLLETQTMKLSEQEKQFNALITRQLERQSAIEAQIKLQQERIDSYIQSLAAQPTAVTTRVQSIPASSSNEVKRADDLNDRAELDSLLHKVQLEKVYLENTLESLRKKHEQEISILEESYKKQIAHLEEALVQMEKRTQDEIECLEADYRTKIHKLKEDLSNCEKARKEDKAMLMEEHAKLIRDIQDRHRKNFDILQEEHVEIIAKITKSKESERQAIEIMRTEGTNVQDLLNRSEFLIETIGKLQITFENKEKNVNDLQANHLSAQDNNIEYLKKLLENQREAFDEERRKFMKTTEKLESNIVELTKEFQKQNSNLQNSEEILKSKEQALLRDREIFAEQMNWERERLKTMMNVWAKEEDKQLEWLAHERQTLASERGKLQIFNRLQNQVDESSKFEIEAAIKAAQDAAFSANQEKLKWQEKMKELDKKQNIIKNQEHILLEKAKELQEFTQSAISKRTEGLKALKEAHFLEQRYKDKFNQLQLQQEILIEKESKLSTEKLELAKARLSLHASEIEKPEKDIGNNYNKTIQEKQVTNHLDVPTTTEYTTYFKEIVDPHLVILKWDLENNLGSSQTTF